MTDTDKPRRPRSYDWRHGWVPRSMRAALQKARGNRELALRYLDAAREHRLSRARARTEAREARGPVEFVPPIPAHRAAAAERARWREHSDDGLTAALGAADVDDATVESILSELDRREQARVRKAEQARARKAKRDRLREAEFDNAVEDGEDPVTAYARIYGVAEERVRRQEATEHLRSAGYRGKSFDELVRAAHREYVDQAHQAAEDELRGHLLSAEGLRLEEAGKLSPADLFRGPEARARKYASEDLRRWWDVHGRMTSDDFRASIIGGHMRHSTTTGTWSG